MKPVGQPSVTQLLQAARHGEHAAMERLFALVYDDLCRVAHRQLGNRRAGQTLDTVALVHEAYLKLIDRAKVVPADRHHFFAIAARAMRQIVVDGARRAHAAKRGGKAAPLTAADALTAIDPRSLRIDDLAAEILALDAALTRLGAMDARLAKVVELRFFGDFDVEEVAEQLKVSPRTIKRDWRAARAFLLSELGA
jgi:RNA polymerase sigma factor (TIGR02999 family)